MPSVGTSPLMEGTTVNLGNRATWVASAAAASTVLALGVSGLPSQAAPAQNPDAGDRPHSAARGPSAQRTPGYLDRRVLAPKAAFLAQRQQVRGQSRGEVSFVRSLGTQAVVDMDPLTGTPRTLTRVDGFLSPPSSKPARTVALDFVRRHLSTLGLSSGDLSTLVFRNDYVDAFGVHHLSWTQVVSGTPVFGNGLKVKVTRRGQVLAVQGSPVPGLTSLAAAASRGTSVDAGAARARAARDVGGSTARASVRTSSSSATTWTNHDYAKRVWFLTPGGLRSGWSTYVAAGDGAYQHVVDSTTGTVLFRRSTANSAEGDAYVFDNYPGAARGGKRKVVNLVKRGWVKRKARFLNGSSRCGVEPTSTTTTRSSRNEKTPVPGTRRHAQFPLKKFTTPASGLCSPKFTCTWDPNKPFSWKKNRNADVAQAFYLASNFHDYLERGPISSRPGRQLQRRAAVTRCCSTRSTARTRTTGCRTATTSTTPT